MESPALKLELSTTKNASVELLFEISILIKILFILLLLICYICCKTDEVFCFAAHLSRTTDLPSFYPKRLDHRAHSALGYLEKYKSFTQQYSGLINPKLRGSSDHMICEHFSRIIARCVNKTSVHKYSILSVPKRNSNNSGLVLCCYHLIFSAFSSYPFVFGRIV